MNICSDTTYRTDAAAAAAAADDDDDDDDATVCGQATESTDRVTKLMKFYGCEYDYDTIQHSDDSVDQSTAKVCIHFTAQMLYTRAIDIYCTLSYSSLLS